MEVNRKYCSQHYRTSVGHQAIFYWVLGAHPRGCCVKPAPTSRIFNDESDVQLIRFFGQYVYEILRILLITIFISEGYFKIFKVTFIHGFHVFFVLCSGWYYFITLYMLCPGLNYPALDDFTTNMSYPCWCVCRALELCCCLVNIERGQLSADVSRVAKYFI